MNQHPWPEEESLNAQFGEVFDEALHPTPTLDQALGRLMELAVQFRASGQVLPEEVERSVHSVEQWAAHALVGHPERACARLRALLPLPAGEPDVVIAHWRACAVCQKAARPATATQR